MSRLTDLEVGVVWSSIIFEMLFGALHVYVGAAFFAGIAVGICSMRILTRVLTEPKGGEHDDAG